MRVEMRSELNRLHRRLKATMIYVTHDQVEAMTMGDRIVVMERGTIQQVAPPLEVYRRPSNLFVAGFIGTPPMNVLRGRFEPREAAGASGTRRARWRCLRAGTCPPAVRRARAAAGVPSESLDGAPAPDTARDAVCGTVDVVEPMGAETFVQVVAADGTRIVARVGAEHTFEPGATVALPLDCDRLRFFEAATGQAIPADGEEAR
jgi:multiple sugar transport system ATP-binding protein